MLVHHILCCMEGKVILAFNCTSANASVPKYIECGRYNPYRSQSATLTYSLFARHWQRRRTHLETMNSRTSGRGRRQTRTQFALPGAMAAACRQSTTANSLQVAGASRRTLWYICWWPTLLLCTNPVAICSGFHITDMYTW